MQFPETLTVRGNMPYAVAEMKRCLTACGLMLHEAGYPVEIHAGRGDSERFTLCVRKTEVRIDADSPRGAVFGVYAFLEQQLGCRFLSEDCEVFPNAAKRTLQLGERTETPDFAYRELYWRGALNGRFALQCRLNSARADITPEMGGRVMFYNYSHTFAKLVPPEIWFDTHPEYFSLIDGARRKEHSQLCLTNPEVLRLCIEGVRGWIRERPDCRIFSVAQNDWYGSCECESCRASDALKGGPSGTLISFVNAVADAIAPDAPDVYIHTFAYLYTRRPPCIMPRENVIVRLCSIESCFSHPLGTCDQAIASINVEEGAARVFERCEVPFAMDLRAWSKIAKNLYIWDYTTNYANYLAPFPNLRVFQPNLRLFRECGVRGVFEQGNYAPGRTSGFAALKIYLLGKLLWNADADISALTREFVSLYYGLEAAPYILRCLEQLEDAASRTHIGIFDAMDVPYLDEVTLKACDTLLLRALQAARSDGVHERIRLERLGITYALLARAPLDSPGRDAAIDAFATETKALGVTELFERRDLTDSIACMHRSRYCEDRRGVCYHEYRL